MKTKIPYQDLQAFGNLELYTKQAVEGFITGLHKSPFHGFSVEFAEHRLYNTGESTKHIDWKLYGRTEKLFVKRFEEETNLRCQIIIDKSSSMYYPFQKKNDEKKHSKLSYSIYCAAALVYLLRKQRDAVGLSLFHEKLDIHTPARLSSTHHKRIFHELEQLLNPELFKENNKTFAIDALHQIADHIHKRSLVIIFSDMFDNSGGDNKELFSALQHFRYNKHEVILFHVTDKSKEIDFDFENRPYKFVDMETSEEIKVSSNDVKEKYIEYQNKFRKELYLRCAQYRIDLVEVDINKTIDDVLMHFLVKRSKLL